MQFIGTRRGERVSAAEAVYNGLSEGGGVYVPAEFPFVGKEARAKAHGDRPRYLLFSAFFIYAEFFSRPARIFQQRRPADYRYLRIKSGSSSFGAETETVTVRLFSSDTLSSI